MQETGVPSLGREDALEEEMTTDSSVLAWEIPWTEEPGGLQSKGLQSWTRLGTQHASLYPSGFQKKEETTTHIIELCQL